MSRKRIEISTKGGRRKSCNRVGKNTNFTNKMKKYQKAKMIAKNLPTGSYAAGCPAKNTGYSSYQCKECERTA